MSALPFTPLTITPRPTESLRPNSPSQMRARAGGWVPSVTNNAASPNQPHALSASHDAASEEAEGWPDPDSPAPLLPSSPAPLFSPDETTAAAIINDFAGQDETLRGIADKYDTTLESLTLWLARPDIKERVHALESACAARARLVVANNLAAIANKLLHLLTESKLDHESIHRVPAATHHAFAARMQSRESARRTANLLLRIARYTPLPTHPTHPTHPDAPPPRASSPRERGEDRLAKGQAGEGTDAHLNADAVQYTAAAPTTNPTRKRGATDAHLALQTPDHQQHCIAPPLPAPPGEAPESQFPSGRAVRGPNAHEPAATIELTEAPTHPTNPTHPTPQRVTTTTPHPPRAASFTSNKTTSSPQNDRPIARVHRDTS